MVHPLTLGRPRGSVGGVAPDPAPSAIDRVRADPRLRTRDDSGVAALVVGGMLWVLALVVMIVAGPSIAERYPGIDVPQWTLVCACGALLTIPGLAIVLARRSRIRRRG